MMEVAEDVMSEHDESQKDAGGAAAGAGDV